MKCFIQNLAHCKYLQAFAWLPSCYSWEELLEDCNKSVHHVTKGLLPGVESGSALQKALCPGHYWSSQGVGSAFAWRPRPLFSAPFSPVHPTSPAAEHENPKAGSGRKFTTYTNCLCLKVGWEPANMISPSALLLSWLKNTNMLRSSSHLLNSIIPQPVSFPNLFVRLGCHTQWLKIQDTQLSLNFR